jgi:hypothetical protein
VAEPAVAVATDPALEPAGLLHDGEVRIVRRALDTRTLLDRRQDPLLVAPKPTLDGAGVRRIGARGADLEPLLHRGASVTEHLAQASPDPSPRPLASLDVAFAPDQERVALPSATVVATTFATPRERRARRLGFARGSSG